jgi:hypothetical protein
VLSQPVIDLDPPRANFESCRRFVGLVDVLGMRRWVEKVGPQKPAADLFALMTIGTNAASVEEIRPDEKRVPLGRVVGAALLSDSILAYSVDDSWASLVAISEFVRALLVGGLARGIPMRGAISIGPVVIDRDRDVLVGAPIGEAYESDRAHSHRGVGVHVTKATVAELAKRTVEDPPGLHLMHAFSPELFRGVQPRGEMLVWFNGALFVEHWGAEYLAGNGGTERANEALDLFDLRFGARGLPEDGKVALKREQSRDFLLDRFRHRDEPRQTFELPRETIMEGRQADLGRLLGIGLRDRATPTSGC